MNPLVGRLLSPRPAAVAAPVGRRSLLTRTARVCNIHRISRQWYEQPPRQAPLPHLTFSEYLPGRPWRDEFDGVVVSKNGKLVTVVLADETQVLGRYPRAIRPVYGPTVHPAKTFTPVPCYEPFPRVVCYDAAEATAVGDRVHANRIRGHFYVTAPGSGKSGAPATVVGDGLTAPAEPHVAFERVYFEIDKIVAVNWETRARIASKGDAIPPPLIRTEPFINRNPKPEDADTAMPPPTMFQQLGRRRDPEETTLEGARVVTRLNVHEARADTMGEFQKNRFDHPSAAAQRALRRLVGPEVGVSDGVLAESLLSTRIHVDVAIDRDVLGDDAFPAQAI